jgi:hypothetical protein
MAQRDQDRTSCAVSGRGGRDGVRLRPPCGHGLVGGLRQFSCPNEIRPIPSRGASSPPATTAAGQEGRLAHDQHELIALALYPLHPWDNAPSFVVAIE